MNKVATKTDRLLSRSEAAEYLNVPVSTLADWATRRVGPRFIKVGRVCRYRVQDLESWLDDKTVSTGAQLI